MLTRTSEYALRAMIHLTRHAEEWPIPGNEIARKTGVPPKYLSAILGNLVRAGVLNSARGKKGGFRMARPPTKITLLHVLAPFERLAPERCPFGNTQCSDEDPCLAHAEWKKVLEARMHFLGRTTIYEVAIRQRDRPVKSRRPHRRTKTAC